VKLYLVRHGEAVSRDVDPERPLSERGRSNVRSVATRLAQAGVRASIALHSGKRRARETAELLGPSIGLQEPLRQLPGLDPLDAVEPFASELDRWTADTMVVGHLPFMGRLVSRLVTGDEEASAVDFRAGTAVCLEREGAGRWSITWVIHPAPTGA
jgi:phosphohistidine phosphatase